MNRGDLLPALVQKTKSVGRRGIPTVGRLLQTLAGSHGIPQDTEPSQVANSLAVLTPYLSCHSRLLEETEGHLGIPFNSPSRQVHLTHTDTGICDTTLSGQRDPASGLHLQLRYAVAVLIGATQRIAGIHIPCVSSHGGRHGTAVSILYATKGGEALGQARQVTDEKTVNEQGHSTAIHGVGGGSRDQSSAPLGRTETVVKSVLAHADAKNGHTTPQSASDIGRHGFGGLSGGAGKGDQQRGPCHGLFPMLGGHLLVDTGKAEAVAGKSPTENIGLLPMGQGVSHAYIRRHSEVSFHRLIQRVLP